MWPPHTVASAVVEAIAPRWQRSDVAVAHRRVNGRRSNVGHGVGDRNYLPSSFPAPAGNHIFRLVHPFVRVCYANGCPTRCRACIGRTSYNPHITKTGCGANVLAPCGCTTIVSPSSRLSYQIGPPHPFPFLFHWSPTFTDGRNPQLVRLRPPQPQQVPSRASTPVGPHVVAPATRRRAPTAHHRQAASGRRS